MISGANANYRVATISLHYILSEGGGIRERIPPLG